MNGFGSIVQKVTLSVVPFSAFLLLTTLTFLLWMPASAATNATTDAIVGNGTAASCTEAALETALAVGGEITFNCGATAHTITLTGVKMILESATVDGNGLITLSGGNTTALFSVPQEITLTVRGLILLNAPDKAIFNSGTLIVDRSTFRNNPEEAIYNAGGRISVTTSTFEGNQRNAIVNENGGTLHVAGSTFVNNSTFGSGDGGAIMNSSQGFATITGSTFEMNHADDGNGGAIYNSHVMTVENSVLINNEAYAGGGLYNHGVLTLINSRISDNEATGGGGGGIVHYNQTTTPSKFTISQTTVDGNRAADNGGAIWFSGAEATLVAVNTTIYSNTAGGLGGGGLFVNTGDATLTNVTLRDNESLLTAGDNIENSSDTPGTITLLNTIVTEGGCVGTVTDGGGNLQFPDATCGNGITVADPLLGNLTDNGGWTSTMALLEGSPARNAALNGNCAATDQRGVVRPQATTCDIGAFEWGALPILTTIVPTATVALSPTFTLVVNGSNFIPGPSGTVVLWNGEELPTSYASGTELRATVAANRIVAAGLVSITVQTPVIDSGISEKTAIFTIFHRNQSIAFAELADRKLEPATFTLNATASSGLAVSYGAAGVCTVEGNTVTLTGEVGNCTISAQQGGNQSYHPAANVVRTFAVVEGELLRLPLISK